MIVSWGWLQEYVDIPWSAEAVTKRLAMAGLNHEGTTPVNGDWAIDLEVTSNRPDCLGHVGVAREIAVLVDRPLRIPQPKLDVSTEAASRCVQVQLDCPALCPCYTARLIRGVRIGPSPPWLRDRLATIGVASVNNVVDVTNYVMFECGQPLHAFDFRCLANGTIVVREARDQEEFLAIDHRRYTLGRGMCVIADPQRAVAIGGVMGGAESEVTEDTTDVLIEAAQFDPLAVRNTARLLNLHSPSSFRFERGTDPENIDWASQRCCELIQQVAGGHTMAGMVAARGTKSVTRQIITLRLSQIPRILGMDIPAGRVIAILTALGMELVSNGERSRRAAPGLGSAGDPTQSAGKIMVTPPSWRPDVTREIDLIEEVARIHGYDAIPDVAAVTLVPAHPSARDTVMARVRRVLTAEGFHEAMTASVIPQSWSETISPWTDQPPLRSILPLLRGADSLRRSLIPSLLMARRENERQANEPIELFETARLYLPQPSGLPEEPVVVGLTSGRPFLAVKGTIELLLAELAPDLDLQVTPRTIPFLDPHCTVELTVQGARLGFLAQLDPAGLAHFELQRPATVAELQWDRLAALAIPVVRYRPPPSQPAIDRDINLILRDEVPWSDLLATIRSEGTDLLESVYYRETYRDEAKDGAGHKRLLFSLRFRCRDRTMTNDEADSLCQRIVAACEKRHGARQVA